MIYLGSDHRGYKLKEEIKKYLGGLDFGFNDSGALEYNENDDYPDFAKAVGEKVANETGAKGILFCGSGIGVAVAANKISGIRAGTVTNAGQTAMAVNDEDLNIIALPADFIDVDRAKEIVKTFLETKFSGAERHIRRLGKIRKLETLPS